MVFEFELIIMWDVFLMSVTFGLNAFIPLEKLELNKYLEWMTWRTLSLIVIKSLRSPLQ